MRDVIDGFTALVTGGTSGIGRSIVEHLSGAGMRVAFTGRDMERGTRVAASTGAHFLRADATDRSQCDQSISRALEALGGRLDLFVSNAGLVFAEPLEETSEGAFREVMEVNLTAAFRFSRACLEAMRAQGRGSIVHVVSDAAIRGIHHIPAYTVSKAGLLAMSEVLAAEAALDGVRVNAICPGAVMPGVQSTIAGYDHHAEDASTWGAAPSGRHGTGADIAQAVLWLASDAAGHVSGATLRIDGAASAAMRAIARA